MRKYGNILFVFLALTFVITGCMPSHTIRYALDENVYTAVGHPYSVTVLPFTDLRENPSYPESKYKNNSYEIEGKICRFNKLEGYEKKEVSTGLSQMLADHLKASHLFSEIQFISPDGELTLSGDIAKFEAVCEVNVTGEKAANTAAALGGLIGASINYAIHKNDIIERWATIELVNIKLKRKSDDSVLWEGNVKEEMRDKIAWTQDKGVYVLADELLKKAVDTLVAKIDRELKSKVDK